MVGCLTVDELLSHFGTRRSPAQEKYRQYVGEGIAGTTIWENLEAQSLLGEEGFAAAAALMPQVIRAFANPPFDVVSHGLPPLIGAGRIHSMELDAARKLPPYR